MSNTFNEVEFKNEIVQIINKYGELHGQSQRKNIMSALTEVYIEMLRTTLSDRAEAKKFFEKILDESFV